MTTTLDPLRAASELTSSYKRYLRSTFAPRDRRLREEFEGALEAGFRIDRGPLLQAASPYATGASVTDLVAEGILSSQFLSIEGDALPPDRPLYRHQEVAIRKLLGGRNVVVATGTGSGKTECFLIPIIEQLFREHPAGTLGDPGVRALLLYPMNALANDQLGRIRRLLAAFPGITFGRYVGDTRDQPADALETYRMRFGADPPSNELISRAAMQDTPPHILLTNYAMLEYLLLRPKDSTFFDGPTGRHWRFVVLDEAHVYDGTRGAELGMLLRRVRDRVHKSTPDRLRCVATSATLGGGSGQQGRLVRFASTLFDERFVWEPDVPAEQDVVRPVHRSLISDTPGWALDDSDVVQLHDLFRSGAKVAEIARFLSSVAPALTGLAAGESINSYLSRVLATEAHVVRLQRLLATGAVDLAEVASTLFDGTQAGATLVALVDLCVAARHSDADAPLIPARYHFLLRALEGAFICLSPAHPDAAPRLLLARHEQCPSCSQSGVTSTMFELAVCRRCGADYLVGLIKDDTDPPHFATAPMVGERLAYLLVDEAMAVEDEDEAAATSDAGAHMVDRQTLCTNCGALWVDDSATCGCPSTGRRGVTVALPARRGDALTRCLACSGRANGSIIYRFLTGVDAPVSVIATSLYQALPPSAVAAHQYKVGSGRKLLCFSDSRQDAAFFAPYLDRTYARAVERSLIWGVLRTLEDEPRLEDLVLPVRRRAEDARVLDEDDGPITNNNRVRTWLMREVLGVDRRQSLEGTGLAEVAIALPRGIAPPPPLVDLGLSEAECLDLARVLLDTVRASAAVTLPDGVDIQDEIFAPRNVVTTMREQGSQPGVLAWLPGSASNRRLDYLAKLFVRRGIGGDPRTLLGDLWSRWFAKPGGPWAKVLPPMRDPRHGTVFALDPSRFQLLKASEAHRPWVCNSCRQLWWRSVASVCPTYRCPGSLQSLSEDAQPGEDHYRHLYESLQAIGMRVEEHTAQLEAEYAGKLQQEFIDGDVNILSCSTTFELGIDVGEIQSVLMRNIPPSPANYVQRSGRAGRRADSAALVVAFAQRRNHDLHFFAQPELMVDGSVSSPVVSLDNPYIVRRHVHAVALAAFERDICDRGGEAHRNVEDFFLEPAAGGASAVDRFYAWLRSRPSGLGAAVERIVPTAAATVIGIEEWSWVDALEVTDATTGAGWLTRATEEVRLDIQEVSAQIEEAASAERFGFAAALKSLRATLTRRPLFDFLAQRGVLPKYGFPVDVVGLDVSRAGDREASRLELTRDLGLAISDYAPGAQVVAAKRLWEVTGLRKPPGRALPRYRWSLCADCGAFTSRLGEQLAGCGTCGSSHAAKGHSGHFVIPLFGFIGRVSGEKPGESRPPRPGYADEYFDDYAGGEPSSRLVMVGGGAVEVRSSRQGRISLVNRGPSGRGFRFCADCGYAEPAPTVTRSTKVKPAPHSAPGPTDRKCTGWLQVTHLGHQYLTDVVELRLPFATTTDEAVSVLAALLSATHAVGISRADVGGTTRSFMRGEPPSLVLFDTVPGGAGHALHLAEVLPDLVAAALTVVEGCECGLETSCYSCLRSYSNQRLHDVLSRGLAGAVLRRLVGDRQGAETDSLGDLLALARKEARPLLEGIIAAGLPAPILGYEPEVEGSAPGWQVEAAWPDRRVALTVEPDLSRDTWLRAQGWVVHQVSEARPDAVIASLQPL